MPEPKFEFRHLEESDYHSVYEYKRVFLNADEENDYTMNIVIFWEEDGHQTYVGSADVIAGDNGEPLDEHIPPEVIDYIYPNFYKVFTNTYENENIIKFSFSSVVNFKVAMHY